ncbi:hypothetical protein NDA18_001027 [Ustilago nuda]|nr:hypothetical protein NDA18_001027 [Ustilago nuda]
MDARGSSSAPDNLAGSASTSAGSDAAKSSIAKDTAKMTDPRRHEDDYEEEEGMLKIDEEGQIEDDSANQKVSHPRPSNEGRSIPLANRLMPLPVASPKKAGSESTSNNITANNNNNNSNNGYISPRHANLDRERERDRDRFSETSPGPSSASSYAPSSRLRFGYPSDASAPYGSSTAYPYPSSHREPFRTEPPFASGSRTSFSGPAPRGENRRGWYPPSTPTTRGPDTYRPGAIRERERERERDWDSFRDGDRDREWSGVDRDRERDSYRDVVDKRRDWPTRERGAAASNYDTSDTYLESVPTNSKYSYDNRDFPARRPSSPPAHLARGREFDADRSRDRNCNRPVERDPRARTRGSGWGSNGMRQWGKPTDAGWDSRSGRRPASDDARSDTSHRRGGSRSNNTPPPATSSEAGIKAIGSDNASERSEARSRDLSPHPTRSPERGEPTDKGAEPSATQPDESVEQAQRSEAEAKEDQRTNADSKQGDRDNKAEAVSQVADAKVDRVEDTDKVESKATDVPAEPTPPETTEPVQSTGSEASTDPEPVKEDSSAEKALSADRLESASQVPAPENEAETFEVKAEEEVDAIKPSAEKEAQPAAPATAKETPAHLEKSAPVQEYTTSTKEVAAEPSTAETTATADAAEQADAEPAPASSYISEPAIFASEEKVEDMAAASVEKDTVASSAEVQLSSTDQVNELMPAQEPSNDQKEEAASSQVVKTTGETPAAVPPAAAATEAKPTSVEAASAEASLTETATPEAPIPEKSVDAPKPEASESSNDVADADMADAVPEQAPAPRGSAEMEVDEPASVAPAADPATSTQVNEESKASEATESVQASEIAEMPVAGETAQGAEDTKPVELEKIAPEDLTAQAEAEASAKAVPGVPSASEAVVEASQSVENSPANGIENANEGIAAEASEAQVQPIEASVKMEKDTAVASAEAAKEPVEAAPIEKPAEKLEPGHQTDQPTIAPVAKQALAVATPTSQPPADKADEPTKAPSQIQISGPHVTVTMDKENKTREITLPQIDYGDDKEAQAFTRQEDARIEEVEMPAEDQSGPALRIAEIDEAAAKEIEPPLITPGTKEQMDHAIHAAVLKHIADGSDRLDDWQRILRENQCISQNTTMNVLKTKIHGIPQSVSSGKPLWLDQEDEETQRTKAQLFDQLTERKKRLNGKVESLKKRYRSINEEWKVHCSRLDRIAERRELLRRPPVNTPAGTPGAFGGEDPSTGAGGGGMLGASLSAGRANRRREQAGFAGFGDAVRSEAEFLEILASLENADMQDPNMRAARTTATAPDMFIDPDSDHLIKLRYDDVNGYVADPLAFYLDEFDPDLWSEEEKAIFARRYALWPKQFGKIAQALPHKTPAQCVCYYYLNKKLPGNNFKALAAVRNRERKRKTRVKPKKAKGSALMADLKSAKGEEMDDVEDGSGVRSPMDSTDPSLADAPTPTNGRGRGRARMVPPVSDGVAEEQTAGRKRTADQTDAEGNSTDAKAEKRKSGPKSKRAKSDSASATDKARKPRASFKKDSAAVDDGKTAGVPPVPAVPGSGPKLEASDASVSASVAGNDRAVAPPAANVGVEDSDLAAAEALGALAGMFGGPAAGDAQPSAGSDAANIGDLSGDGRKTGKKRRSKTAAAGEGADGSGKGRGKQPTSSYWSVAERCEFLRALVVHGPRWEVVSSTLAQKSAAQARNYFARNEDENDFAEAAALSRSHADLSLAEREAAALAFVRNRFASNSTGTGVLPASSSGGALPSMVGQVPGYTDGPAGPRTTHLPPPPGISASQADMVDVKMREESPEPEIQRRGLQINSLLNDSNDAASSRMKRRSSLHELQGEREDAQHMGLGRDASVPPALGARQVFDLDRSPLAAGRLEAGRPLSSDGRSMRDDRDERARLYERMETQHRVGEDVRQMLDEGQVDSRSWTYDSPYEAHRRPSPQPGYASMAPPSHPAERGMPASRYSMPPSSVASAGHLGRSMPPMSSHLHHSEESELDRERERERAYGMYGVAGGPGRSREHELHSMPPAVPGELRHSDSGERLSPTNVSFGSAPGYGRYAPPGVGSIYSSPSAAVPSALASRSRPTSGPLTAPPPSTTDRPAYEQRCQRYSQSPGPSTTPTSAGVGPGAGGFSTASAYRSSNNPYSSFPSQSLPRPSLPSLSASGGPTVGAPHLPSLGAAGRSLPPILGFFPTPGRGMGVGARPSAGAGAGEEAAARYWPYPHRPRTHNSQPHGSGRTPE